MKIKRFSIILLTIALLLLVPLIAMQFTDQVNWTPFDFVIAAVLLLGIGILCELAVRKIKNNKIKIIVCIGLVLLLFLVWAELAVGLIGTPFAGD